MFITPANMRTGLLLLILCFFCPGCVHYSTTAERDASFFRYKDTKVGNERLRKYLIDRSAVLLMADRLDTHMLGTNSAKISSTNAWHGMATAIDSRGYFLTAAHCVTTDRVNGWQFWLAFLEDGKLQVRPARIVWCGDVKKREPDLAILSVSHPIGQSFEWATDITNRATIMAVGLSQDSLSGAFKTQCMAGKIMKVSEKAGDIPSDYTVVDHDSPLRHGDSGGPLALSDGQLLGINVSGDIGIHWQHLLIEPLYYEAHRPNLEWLRKVIDRDAASQSVSWPNTALEPTADPRFGLSGSAGFAESWFGGGSAFGR